MTDRRAVRELWKWIVVVLAAAQALYVGSYYAMVRRSDHIYYVEPSRPGGPDRDIFADYRVPFAEFDDRWQRLFEPMHQLDRRLRPQYWEPEPD